MEIKTQKMKCPEHIESNPMREIHNYKQLY